VPHADPITHSNAQSDVEPGQRRQQQRWRRLDTRAHVGADFDPRAHRHARADQHTWADRDPWADQHTWADRDPWADQHTWAHRYPDIGAGDVLWRLRRRSLEQR
jgi:hypothetical protein